MSYDVNSDPKVGAIDEARFGRSARAVTPSDTVDLKPYARAIVVIATGNLVILPVENADASTVTFTGVPVGFVPPFKVRRVLSTGTTASVVTVD